MTRAKDGGLRRMFRDRLPAAQWSSVESPLTGGGLPDSEYCFAGGRCGWLELKKATRWKVTLRPAQAGWLLRRTRLGGRAWVAVRRQGRTERGGAYDDLWLVHGSLSRVLTRGTLRDLRSDYADDVGRLWASWEGGPSYWDWSAVEKLLQASYPS